MQRSVVWVFWGGGEENDELRYSIRCATTNIQDAANFVICGDKPDYYTGLFIPSPKFTKRQAKIQFRTGRWAKWVDSIIKLQKIIDDPQVTDEFLWMYDDTFIVKPTTIEALSIPYYTGQLTRDLHTPVKHTWRECMRRTAVALQEFSLPTLNYSTHYPVVYNKEKLQEVIDLFRPDVKPRVIESLYYNLHAVSPQRLANQFQYNKHIYEGWSIRPSATVVNVGGFKTPVKDVISALYPTPSPYERG